MHSLELETQSVVRRLVRLLRRRFRSARFLQIHRRLGDAFGQGWVLDLGGGPGSYFAALFPDKKRVILLDISRREVVKARQELPELRAIVADGGNLPFEDSSMALIVSNSVIEHVPSPQLLSTEIRRVGQTYFVQTPHAGFPVETHSYVGIPFYRHLRPRRVRILACQLFGANFQYIESVHYLTEVELHNLFPGARIEHETVLGLTKSFFVIGGQNSL